MNISMVYKHHTEIS